MFQRIITAFKSKRLLERKIKVLEGAAITLEDENSKLKKSNRGHKASFTKLKERLEKRLFELEQHIENNPIPSPPEDESHE